MKREIAPELNAEDKTLKDNLLITVKYLKEYRSREHIGTE
jgi:hypothetical protein